MRSGVLAGLVLLAGCQSGQDSAPVAASDAPAATAAASPVLPDPPPNIPQYQALGTEPFWSLTSSPGSLRYSSPEALDGISFPVRTTFEGEVTRYAGTLQDKPVVLVITPGTCSDGMSDTVYPYKAAFTWGGRTEQGCARRK